MLSYSLILWANAHSVNMFILPYHTLTGFQHYYEQVIPTRCFTEWNLFLLMSNSSRSYYPNNLHLLYILVCSTYRVTAPRRCHKIRTVKPRLTAQFFTHQASLRYVDYVFYKYQKIRMQKM